VLKSHNPINEAWSLLEAREDSACVWFEQRTSRKNRLLAALHAARQELNLDSRSLVQHELVEAR
jgi:hypothetical protein